MFKPVKRKPHNKHDFKPIKKAKNLITFKPVKHNKLKASFKPIKKNKTNIIKIEPIKISVQNTGNSFIGDEINRIMKHYNNIIMGRMASFRHKYPILNNKDIIEEIKDEITIKLVSGISNRVIQLYKMSDSQLNVMVQRVATNAIIDYLRQVKRGPNDVHINYEAMIQYQDAEIDKYGMATNQRSYDPVAAHKFGTESLLDNPEDLVAVNELHYQVIEELGKYDSKSQALYISLLEESSLDKMNNPRIVALKNEVISIMEHHGR